MNSEYEKKRKDLIHEHNSGICLKKLSVKYHIGKSTACRWIKEDRKLPVEDLKTLSRRELYLMEQEVARLRKQVAIYENSQVTEKLTVVDKCLIVDKLAPQYGMY